MVGLALVVTLPVWAPLGPGADAQAPAAGAAVTPPEGSLVVALRSLGQVNAILPSGQVQVLARGLAEPGGVVVLADGTVLVAETGADRISGFGGRLGATPEPVAALPAPTGLATASDGSVFATDAGEVGRVDLAARQFQVIAGGFVSATQPAVRDGVLYVPDFATGEVASIDVASGADLGAVASGLATPGGAATAPGLPLFVSEAGGDQIVRVDPTGGAPSPFGRVIGPFQLAIDPPNPGGDEWRLVVATAEGLVFVDSAGRVADRVSLPLTAGVAAVPTAAAPAAPGVDAGGAGTTVLKDEEDGGSGSPLLLIGGLVLVGAVAAVVATVLLARRAGRREREIDGVLAPPPEVAGWPERVAGPGPGGSESVHTGCGEEEMEVDRLQNQLRQVSAQVVDLRGRVRDSTEKASEARDRAMRALEVRASVQASRARGDFPDDGEPLTWARLSFRTDEGRDAFESFRRRELTPAQLRERFEQLGEHTAVAQIMEEGRRQMRRDPDLPWPEERQAVRDAIAARDELRAHERDAEATRADVEQLADRERELGEELAAARLRLDECRRSQASSRGLDDF